MYTSIVQELKSVLSSENILEQTQKVKELENQLKNIEIDNTEEEDINRLLAQDLLTEISKKIKSESDLLKSKAEKHKKKKEQLINDLTELIANEENIGKAFSAIKIITEEWKKENENETFKLKDLDKKFSKLIEDFYYNINIYKAIQEHDLKRNQQIKTKILTQLETCTKQDVSRALMSDIKKLRNEWESTGPIKREEQDDYWNKYRAFLDQLYNSFNEYKASEKEQFSENLKDKIKIIEFIKSIKIEDLKSHRDWKAKTDKIIDCQKKWKDIGHVPSEHKDLIWNEYRQVCDDFFNSKKVFYDQEKDRYKANKKQKLEICKTAEEYNNIEDLEDASAKFIALQKKWKNIGAVHQRDEQFLWHKFQKSCNAFFAKKKEAGKLANQEKDIVNDEKQVIIDSLNSTEITKDVLKEIFINWLKTNRIHTKKSNTLKQTFIKELDVKLQSINIDLDSFTDELFENKVKLYKSFAENQEILTSEIENLKKQLDSVQKEITQYENNLGFFGNSKGASKLLEEVQTKIENHKKLALKIKHKLKQLK